MMFVSQNKKVVAKNPCWAKEQNSKREGIVFNDLDNWDMAVLLSQVNSQPWKNLSSKSPIQVFKSLYGEAEKIS